MDDVDSVCDAFVSAGGFISTPDGKSVDYSLPNHELSPELLAIKEKMDRWTPAQWEKVNEYLRARDPGMPPRPTAP